MSFTQLIAASGLTLALASSAAFAGVVDPDGKPERAKDAAKNVTK